MTSTAHFNTKVLKPCFRIGRLTESNSLYPKFQGGKAMTPVSGMNANTVRPLTESKNVIGPAKARQLEEETPDRPLKPATDEYVPSEKPESSGRYRIGQDKDGQPKVCFDNPEKEGKEKSRCTCNTDRVDREIEKLRDKKEELERQLSAETDETKVKNLKNQLAQIERELNKKDNDTYRRGHADFT